ncbi:hypothetical protein [Salinarimonas sp.]|uniref:hypothetical protein n=1 Tax=Salinarimonas sp. TaxID=2766526 RepID=UPI00391CDADC
MASGPILHRYGEVGIGLGPAMAAGAPLPEDKLSPEALEGLGAFKVRNSSSYVEAKRRRPYPSASWSGNDQLAALDPPMPMDAAGSPLAAAPPKFRLSGTIAVGTIIVHTSGSSFEIPRSEQAMILADVQNGLSFLAAESPAKDITFVHDTKVIDISTPAVGTKGSFEDAEAPWRDQALSRMNYSPGARGVAEYVADLRRRFRTELAFCAFFVEYPLYHFAYAYPAASYLVMDINVGPWTAANRDSVYAHEVCHLFGAPDEYLASRCNCGGSWGVYRVPNVNCEPCAVDPQECIMRNNVKQLCTATRYHVGYRGLPPYSGGRRPATV